MAAGGVIGVLIGTLFNSLPVGVGAGVAGAFVVGWAIKYFGDIYAQRAKGD
jgi:hypothetical protein